MRPSENILKRFEFDLRSWYFEPIFSQENHVRFKVKDIYEFVALISVLTNNGYNFTLINRIYGVPQIQYVCTEVDLERKEIFLYTIINENIRNNPSFNSLPEYFESFVKELFFNFQFEYRYDDGTLVLESKELRCKFEEK